MPWPNLDLQLRTYKLQDCQDVSNVQ